MSAGVGVISVGVEVVERGLGVDRPPEHDDVDHDAEGVELVFLPDLVVLADLSAVAVKASRASPFRVSALLSR